MMSNQLNLPKLFEAFTESTAASKNKCEFSAYSSNNIFIPPAVNLCHVSYDFVMTCLC
jgi:hypothetical protein